MIATGSRRSIKSVGFPCVAVKCAEAVGWETDQGGSMNEYELRKLVTLVKADRMSMANSLESRPASIRTRP